MIVYFKKKSKELLKEWGIGVGGILVCSYGFFVWSQIVLSHQKTIQIIKFDKTINIMSNIENISSPIQNTETDYQYVASSRGKYYYPKNCSRARNLSPQNMLYFKDKIAAEAAGYIPHSAC